MADRNVAEGTAPAAAPATAPATTGSADISKVPMDRLEMLKEQIKNLPPEMQELLNGLIASESKRREKKPAGQKTAAHIEAEAQFERVKEALAPLGLKNISMRLVYNSEGVLSSTSKANPPSQNSTSGVAGSGTRNSPRRGVTYEADAGPERGTAKSTSLAGLIQQLYPEKNTAFAFSRTDYLAKQGCKVWSVDGDNNRKLIIGSEEPVAAGAPA